LAAAVRHPISAASKHDSIAPVVNNVAQAVRTEAPPGRSYRS
jgi:hypothetical protein